jgi:polar amino acid transport system substrate-binding protein
MIRALATLAVLAGPAVAEDLRIGTEPDYAPYAFYEDGVLQGFDIDLGNAICDRGGFTCTWVEMAFEDLVGAVAAGEIDIAIAGMAATPSRAEIVDFSIPYRATNVPNFAAFASLLPGLTADGVMTAVQSGTIYVDHLAGAGQPFQTYPDMTAMIAALRAGEVQAIFGGYGNIEELIERGEAGLRIIASVEMEGYGTSIAVTRLKAGLTQRIDGLIEGLSADGVLDELETRWFAVGLVL